MILNDLMIYLESHKKVSVEQLAKHFLLSVDGVHVMMALWVKKGKVNPIMRGEKIIAYRLLDANELSITLLLE